MWLTIAIPTINRCQSLQAVLETLRRELDISSLFNDVEVLISDNGSSDLTQDVIEHYRQFFLNFRAVRHSSNIGFSGNFASLFQHARGQWTLVIGDDDHICNTALAELLRSLKEIDRLHVFDSSPSREVIRRNLSGRKGFCKILGEQSIDFLGIFQFSFIGNVVFPTELSKELAERIDRRSAYPSVILSLMILSRLSMCQYQGSRITVENGVLRKWESWQPIYTAIDMAKVLSDHASLQLPHHSQRLVRTFLLLSRNVPRAVFAVRTKRLANQTGNPFREVSFRNISAAYSGSTTAQIVALILYALSSICPIPLLRYLVREQTTKNKDFASDSLLKDISKDFSNMSH